MANNSIQWVIDYLTSHPGRSEKQIQKDVFGYDRKRSYFSNKKYADMLRRGLSKGIIKRTKVKGKPYRYIYFINNEGLKTWGQRKERKKVERKAPTPIAIIPKKTLSIIDMVVVKPIPSVIPETPKEVISHPTEITINGIEYLLTPKK